MKKAKERNKPKSYFWEIIGLLFGIFMFFTSITVDEQKNATGEITYNDDGLVSFKSYRLDAFYGLLVMAGSIACIWYKKKE